jgi:hypothetical protein
MDATYYYYTVIMHKGTSTKVWELHGSKEAAVAACVPKEHWSKNVVARVFIAGRNDLATWTEGNSLPVGRWLE